MNEQQLTFEQEFTLRVFTDQVQRMSDQQAKQLLITLQETLMQRENMYLELLRNAWDIGYDPLPAENVSEV